MFIFASVATIVGIIAVIFAIVHDAGIGGGALGIFVAMQIMFYGGNAFDTRNEIQVYTSAAEKCKYLEGTLQKVERGFRDRYKCTLPDKNVLVVE